MYAPLAVVPVPHMPPGADELACFCSNAATSSSDVQTEAIANGTSLIPETLEEMATDTDFQQTAERLRRLGQAAMTREEKQKRQRSLDKIGVPSFGSMVKVGLSLVDFRKQQHPLFCCFLQSQDLVFWHRKREVWQ